MKPKDDNLALVKSNNQPRGIRPSPEDLEDIHRRKGGRGWSDRLGS